MAFLDWFQSTRPRGARRERTLDVLTLPKFQSTRPRGARLQVGQLDDLRLAVSIHAPARGATQDLVVALVGLGVSIHAPARGATVLVVPGGGNGVVSIHAPARGATWRLCRCCWLRSGFNPRAREGRDAGWRGCSRLPACFNPRAREGRDLPVSGPHAVAQVSIHAPARGATLWAFLSLGLS